MATKKYTALEKLHAIIDMGAKFIATDMVVNALNEIEGSLTSTSEKIGYHSCWKEGSVNDTDILGHCPMPKGHDGSCAFF